MHYLFDGVVCAVSDIVEYCIVEHERFLLNKADARAVKFHINITDIDTVQQDIARIVIVVAQKQIDECRFPRAGCADDADDIPRFNG